MNELCKLMSLDRKGLIIKNIKFNNKDKSIDYEIYNSKRKVVIPNGSVLVHKSAMRNIKTLTPCFISKKPKSYLYGYPRIYFSIFKSNILNTDIKFGSNTYDYILQTNIKEAFPDPLLPIFSNNYYIETKFGIPVKNKSDVVKPNKIQESFYDALLEAAKEDPIVNWIVTECPYMIDIIFEEELMTENVITNTGRKITNFKNSIGNKIKSYLSKENIEKKYRDISNKITNRKTMVLPCDKESYDEIYKWFDKCKDESSYLKYSKSFKRLCVLLGISSNDTILEYMITKEKPSKENDNKYVLEYRYSSSKKIPFIIPNNSILIHKSPLKDLKVLKPTFKSKTRGMYLYGSPRIYFALGKMMDDKKMATENKSTYTYTPKENIKKAYIDPAIKSKNSIGSAIYVDTQFPIAVKKID